MENKELPLISNDTSLLTDVRKHAVSCQYNPLKNETTITNPIIKREVDLSALKVPAVVKNFSGTLVLSNNSTFQQYIDDKQKWNTFKKSHYKNWEKDRKRARTALRNKLFQVREEPPKFCNSYNNLLLTLNNGKIVNALFRKFKCRAWNCPNCNENKAKSLRLRLTKIAELNNLTYFITLTLDKKKIPINYYHDTHKYITKLYNHFLTVLKRKSFIYFDKRLNKTFTFDLSKREKLKYIWIIEFQKNGNAHMHILCNQFLPAIVIRKIWQDVGGGSRIDIQNVKSIKRVSNYIFSYLLKGIKDLNLQKNGNYGFKYFQRRYSVSRSCILPEKQEIKNLHNIPYVKIKEVLEKQGLVWIIKELNNNESGDILKVTFDDNSPAPNL